MMDDGKIVERGSHTDLLAADGDYADLGTPRRDRTVSADD